MNMKLNLGSLNNCLADTYGAADQLPEIGSGGTINSYTDRYPVTVISARRTKSGKMIVEVQYDLYDRTDKNGMSESQTYSFTPNPSGMIVTYKQRKDGVLRESAGGNCLILGHRARYYDFSF